MIKNRKAIILVVILSITQFMACSNKKNIINQNATTVAKETFTIQEDDNGPPPPNFVSRFKTMNEWLTFIVDNENPKKAISKYNFDLFEGKDNYTLCLTGVNTYHISNTSTKVKIEFTPKESFFSLPLNDHKGLTRAQVLENLTHQLNDFIESNKFKSSYFTKAKSIRTSWKGEIWPHK